MRALLFLLAALLVLVASKYRPKPHSREHKRHKDHHRRPKQKTGPVLGPVIPVSFAVEAEVLLSGRFIICPKDQVERCSTDRCLDYTCKDIYKWSKTDCPTIPKELCQGEVTCGCDHNKGFFLKDNASKECIDKDDPKCVSVEPDCSEKNNSVVVCPDACIEWTTKKLHSDRNKIKKGYCTEAEPKNYNKCKTRLTCQCVFPYVRDDVTHEPGCVNYIDGLRMLCASLDDHRELDCDGGCLYDYCFKPPVLNPCPTDDKALEKCYTFGCQCINNFAFDATSMFGNYKPNTAPVNSTKYCIPREDCNKKYLVPDCSEKTNSVVVCPDDCVEWTTMTIFNDRGIINKGKCTNATIYNACKSPLTCQCVFPYVRDDVTHEPGCVNYIDGLKTLCESVDDHRELSCEDSDCYYNYCFKDPVTNLCPTDDKALEKCKKFGCQCFQNYAFNTTHYFADLGIHTAPVNSTKYCVDRNDCKKKS